MSSFSELQAHNNEIQVLVNNKDFKNDKLKKCIKLAKVGLFGCRSAYIVILTSKGKASSISNRHVLVCLVLGRFSELNLMYILSSRNHKEY